MDPGQLLARRFLLLAQVGAGAMGTVFRAEDRIEGGLVAVKVLRTEEETDRLRFAQECRLLARLDESGIVAYVDQGTTPEGEPFLAMEWVDGDTLEAYLKREGMTLTEAVGLVRQVAQSVGTLHALEFIHRDLKPANVLLNGSDPAHPKLVDLGLVRPADATLTLAGMIVGTPGYMAPEQARAAEDIDPRADVFALGCILFRCITGEAPFEAHEPVATLLRTLLDETPSIRALRPDAPPELDQLVTRLLAKDRDDRPADGTAVAQLLQRIGDGATLSERRPRQKPGLTDAERRVTCLVVGRFDDPPEGDAPSASPLFRLQSARPVLGQLGARLEALAGGTLVVSLAATGGSAGDLAARGVRCALALRKSCEALRLVVVTGTAIDTGGTLVGATIERAVDMLAAATPVPDEGIALDRATAALVKTRFVIESTHQGLRLVSEREREGLRTLLGRQSDFVGRAAELAALRAVFDDCESACRAQAVVVEAPAGLGKSRLRHELLGQLEARRPDIAIWSMRGDPLHAGSPFGLVAPMIRRLAGILDAEPLDQRRAKLRDRVAQVVAPDHVERVTDFLGVVASVPGNATAEIRAARRDPTLMGDQIRRAFSDLVTGECAFGSLIVVVEDLHWGDLPSVKLLEAALTSAAQRPLLVLALARPEVNDVFPRLWEKRSPTRLELHALGPGPARRLARQALGARLSDEIVDQLVRRAQGNAFFLEELIRAVARGNLEALPDTVLATVQARLDTLPAEARRLLRAASVFGQRFASAGVAALIGGSPAVDVDLCLDDLVEQEILAPRDATRSAGEREYAFRHALMQEAAYAMLTDEDRQLAHRLAAEWLEEADVGDPVALAEHFERGQCPGRAVPWWTRAAAQALDGNDLDQVIDRVERAIACGADDQALGELQVLAAEASLWRGETDAAEHEALEALSRTEPGSPAYCRAAAVGATAAGRRGNQTARTDIVDSVLALDPATDHEPDRIVCLAQCSIQLVFAGDLEGADRLLGRIEHTGRAAAEDHGAAASVLRARAWRAISAGDPGTYGALMRNAANRFEQVGDTRNACVQRVNVAYAEASVGAYESSIQGYQEVVSRAQRLGLASVAAVARHNLGLALAMVGHFDEAEREERLALDAFELQSDRRLTGNCTCYLALIALAKGDLAAATEAARRAEAIQVAPSPPRAMALATLARVLVAAGRAEESLTQAREAQALLDLLGGVDEGEALIRLALAEALAATGRHADACDAIRAARDRLHERAARITPDSWRQTFLARVPEHRRTLELAVQWHSSRPDEPSR